jgi:hypothetical protein
VGEFIENDKFPAHHRRQEHGIYTRPPSRAVRGCIHATPCSYSSAAVGTPATFHLLCNRDYFNSGGVEYAPPPHRVATMVSTYRLQAESVLMSRPPGTRSNTERECANIGSRFERRAVKSASALYADGAIC